MSLCLHIHSEHLVSLQWLSTPVPVLFPLQKPFRSNLKKILASLPFCWCELKITAGLLQTKKQTSPDPISHKGRRKRILNTQVPWDCAWLVDVRGEMEKTHRTCQHHTYFIWATERSCKAISFNIPFTEPKAQHTGFCFPVSKSIAINSYQKLTFTGFQPHCNWAWYKLFSFSSMAGSKTLEIQSCFPPKD